MSCESYYVVSSCILKLTQTCLNVSELDEAFQFSLCRIGGALHRLAGIFTGHTPQHQILAAKCITNIASTSYAEKLIKPLGSYLVAFLSSPYVVLKVCCIYPHCLST